jgi:hypothetical protein
MPASNLLKQTKLNPAARRFELPLPLFMVAASAVWRQYREDEAGSDLPVADRLMGGTNYTGFR